VRIAARACVAAALGARERSLRARGRCGGSLGNPHGMGTSHQSVRLQARQWHERRRDAL